MRTWARRLSAFALLNLWTLSAAKQAAAWEWLPEYQTLTETEQAEFETPYRFTGEYPADILAYMKPASWEYAWLTHDNAFDLNLGSLSATHFQIENRLKLRAMLTGVTQFRFTYFQEQNRERDTSHFVLEFVFWPFRQPDREGGWNFGLSLYGEPALYKRNNDTGIALIAKPNPRHEIRLYNTFVDVTRQKRNDLNDIYIEPQLPYTRGITGRAWSDPEEGKQEFIEYALRYDTPTEWLFPDEGYLYKYWKAFGMVTGSKTITKDWSFNLRTQFDRKFESRSPSTPTSAAQDVTWRTDRFFVLLRGVLSNAGPYGRWEFTPGIEYQNRLWVTSPSPVTYRDILPHLGWKIPGFSEGDTWNFMVIMNWHRAFGPIELRDPQDEDAKLQQKIDIGYEFSFGQKGSLVLMATGDLDEFFTRHSWDGGSAQLRLYF